MTSAGNSGTTYHNGALFKEIGGWFDARAPCPSRVIGRGGGRATEHAGNEVDEQHAHCQCLDY